MRTVLIIMSVAVILTSSNSYARIGESKSEIENRYGKGSPIHEDAPPPGDEYYIYWPTGVTGDSVKVTYWNGLSGSETYCLTRKNDSNESKIKSVNMTNNLSKLDAILDANSGGSTWGKFRGIPEYLRVAWLRADGKVYAHVHTNTPNVITVMSVDFIKEGGRRENLKEQP